MIILGFVPKCRVLWFQRGHDAAGVLTGTALQGLSFTLPLGALFWNHFPRPAHARRYRGPRLDRGLVLYRRRGHALPNRSIYQLQMHQGGWRQHRWTYPAIHRCCVGGARDLGTRRVHQLARVDRHRPPNSGTSSGSQGKEKRVRSRSLSSSSNSWKDMPMGLQARSAMAQARY